MTSDSGLGSLRQPDEVEDPLTAIPRTEACRPLAPAVEAEAEAFLAEVEGLRQAHGRKRVVRQGNGPDRAIQTGIGPVPVRRVELRDHGAGREEAGEERARIGFASALLPGSHPRR